MKSGLLLIFTVVYGLLYTTSLYAQDLKIFSHKPLDIDTTLFRLHGTELTYLHDTYSHHKDLLRYLDVGSTRQDIFTHDIAGGDITLFGSSTVSRVGTTAHYAQPLPKGWTGEGMIYFNSGRDRDIEGCFGNNLYSRARLTKRYSAVSYLRFEAELPWYMRSLKGGATEECYNLTNNKLYNPNWGFYKGEVRSSNVLRVINPTLHSRYQTQLTSSTYASADLTLQYHRSALSDLGWYDSYTPRPNYYYKLPSHYTSSPAYEIVKHEWQEDNPLYTQIAWDKLDQENRKSPSGASHYIVEDNVSRGGNVDLQIMFETKLRERLHIEYGVSYRNLSHRYFKQLRDLLGGDYLLDVDQHVGDLANSANNLQNDLRHPNRKITQGERFGYDYSLSQHTSRAIFKLDYSHRNLDYKISFSGGGSLISRCGHYEKERFADKKSYGTSPTIALPNYLLSGHIGYAIASQHYLSLEVGSTRYAPHTEELFIAPDYCNHTVSNPINEGLEYGVATYSYSMPRFRIYVEGYALLRRNERDVRRGYDDLSREYCNIVVSEINSFSLGVEIAGEYMIDDRISLRGALNMGSHRYISSPLVEWHQDINMKHIATSRSSFTKGYIIGNNAGVIASADAKYNDRGFELKLGIELNAQRYITPSLIRRTERITYSVTTPERLNDIITQQRLPNICNLKFSASKSLRIHQSHYLTIAIEAKNILGQPYSLRYARESDRVVRISSNDTSYNFTPLASIYDYTPSHEFYISLRYSF